MATIDLNDEKMFELVTEALRAGPGTPQWHEAVGLLRQNGTSNSGDELTLLYSAREHLESGREYRSVRPGPRFTRKVMEEVDRESAGGGAARSSWSVATIVAAVSAIVLIAAIALVVYFAIPSGDNTQAALEQLKGTYFVNPVVTTQFEGSIGEQWRTIGNLPVTSEGGLRPGKAAAPDASAIEGGGVVIKSPLSSNEPFAIEVAVESKSSNVEIEVFVTDEPQFSQDRATSSHELTWAVQGGRALFIGVDGQLLDNSADGSSGTTTLRMTLGKTVGVVETNGTKRWEGAHELSPEKSRYVGVRFVKERKVALQGEAVVKSIRISKASKS